MSSLFIASTSLGWADLMFHGISSRGENMTPSHLENKEFSFFFVTFIVISCFFMLNFYTGVIISTYNREKDKAGKGFLLTSK